MDIRMVVPVMATRAKFPLSVCGLQMATLIQANKKSSVTYSGIIHEPMSQRKPAWSIGFPIHSQLVVFTHCSLVLFSLFPLELWAMGKGICNTHYSGVIKGEMASQLTGLTIVYSTIYSGADQRKHQSSASLAFVRGIHRWPVNSLHKWPVTRKMFPSDDVIMIHHSGSESIFFIYSILGHDELTHCRWRHMASSEILFNIVG